jgi:hypothetical protein
MAENNGNINKVLLVLVSMLLGVVLTGVSMVVRGDMLGKDAADAVEERVNERMDREFGYLKDILERIEDRMDP